MTAGQVAGPVVEPVVEIVGHRCDVPSVADPGPCWKVTARAAKARRAA